MSPTHTISRQSLGERIKAVREAKGLTQGDVAGRLDVVHTTFGDYEKASDLKHGTIKNIAAVLEIDSAYLTGEHPHLQDVDVAIVVRRESLRLFLEQDKIKTGERKKFARISDLAAAPTTIARWRELRELIHKFLGNVPGRAASAANEVGAAAIAGALTAHVRKKMAKAVGEIASSAVRKAG